MEFIQRTFFDELVKDDKLLPFQDYFDYTGYIVRGKFIGGDYHPFVKQLMGKVDASPELVSALRKYNLIDTYIKINFSSLNIIY